MELLKDNYKKIFNVTLLLAAALISIFVISKFAAAPETYRATIQSIDDKKTAVTEITAAAAAASALLAAVPGDVTTPAANQIMEITSYLMIVVCVLVLEKSLLTLTGYLSFNVLIPAACVLLGVNVFIKKKSLKMLALKLIAFAVIIVMIIPISLKLGDKICETNSVIIEQTAESADKYEAEDSGEAASWIDGIIGKLKNNISDARDYAKQKLNNFTDTVSVFIIAYCVIPIMVILFMIWLAKLFFGLSLPRGRIAEKE